MLGSRPDNRGSAKFSNKKYYAIRRLIFSKFGSFKKLGEKMRADMRIQEVAAYLLEGDIQPAVVVSADPFMIAAYSDEFDTVVMLEFPKELAEQYGLSKGSRLVTSNVYLESAGSGIASDIFPGPCCSRKYAEFVPVVQLFLCSDDEKAAARTSLFNEDHWRYIEKLAAEYVSAHPGLVRDGFFYFK